MKENLEKALVYANEHSKEKQLQYTNQYNKKAKHKAFEPGENVIVLYPTSSNKLTSRWHGPCTILEKRSKYSYLVDMGNECHKIIHANKIRKYYTRALACGLIAEEDEEFGSVVEVPLKQEEQKKERLSIDAKQINHLSTEQQGQLLTILNKYQDRFTENTGLCTLVEHEIELKPDFRVKEFAAYRIQFAYRPEMERQIQDRPMLQQGIIKPYSRRIHVYLSGKRTDCYTNRN